MMQFQYYSDDLKSIWQWRVKIVSASFQKQQNSPPAVADNQAECYHKPLPNIRHPVPTKSANRNPTTEQNTPCAPTSRNIKWISDTSVRPNVTPKPSAREDSSSSPAWFPKIPKPMPNRKRLGANRPLARRMRFRQGTHPRSHHLPDRYERLRRHERSLGCLDSPRPHPCPRLHRSQTRQTGMGGRNQSIRRVQVIGLSKGSSENRSRFFRRPL